MRDRKALTEEKTLIIAVFAMRSLETVVAIDIDRTQLRICYGRLRRHIAGRGVRRRVRRLFTLQRCYISPGETPFFPKSTEDKFLASSGSSLLDAFVIRNTTEERPTLCLSNAALPSVPDRSLCR
ncbi:hypothetical protein V3C99_015393 [Haemonchus contortus]